MSASKLKVVLTRRLPDAVETRMRELFDAELNLKDQPMDRAALQAAVQRAEVLAPTITDVIDADLINGAGDQLKMIANFGAGVDHIDVEAAVARAESAGLLTVQNRCVKIEHARIFGGLGWMGVNTKVISSKRPQQLPY